MIVERGGAGESSSAESAFEGSIGGMSDHVIPQLVRRRKDQAAETALVRIRRSLVAKMHLGERKSLRI